MMKISKGQSVTQWTARCQESLKTVHLGVKGLTIFNKSGTKL